MTKPIVKIKDAFVFNECLNGIPLDYPDDHQYYAGCLSNGKPIYTSRIVKIDGDTVETQRTIYEVQNWITGV